MSSQLTSDFLLSAYCHGYFPMAESRQGPIGWYEPFERAILEFDNLKISRSLAKVVGSDKFALTIDRAFSRVVHHCATTRDETWISPEIEAAYAELHHIGFAHSLEVWQDQELVGGLYGVSINGAFFGESMFHCRRDASKAALVYLVEHLKSRGFLLLDCQYINPHMESLGASVILREAYQERLAQALAASVSFLDSSPRLHFDSQQSR